MTPLTKLRAYCVQCNGGRTREVETCDAECAFHKFRMGRGRPSVRAFRSFCLECMGGHIDFVRDCETSDCPCWIYRMGKKPARAGICGKGRGETGFFRRGSTITAGAI